MSYNLLMATKTRRWETRVDEEADALVAAAADALGVKKSAFITQSARAEAERVLARADYTVMPDYIFSSLIDSLDVPDEAPALAQLSTTQRPYSHL